MAASVTSRKSVTTDDAEGQTPEVTQSLDELAREEMASGDSALTEGEGWKTLRLDGLRYVLEGDGSEALYDLERDPCAHEDVAADSAYQDVLMGARHTLLARLLARERPLRRGQAY